MVFYLLSSCNFTDAMLFSACIIVSCCFLIASTLFKIDKGFNFLWKKNSESNTSESKEDYDNIICKLANGYAWKFVNISIERKYLIKLCIKNSVHFWKKFKSKNLLVTILCLIWQLEKEFQIIICLQKVNVSKVASQKNKYIDSLKYSQVRH